MWPGAGLWRGWVLIWWLAWCGAWGFRWAGLRGMRLIRRGIWGRGLRMRFYRLREKVDRIRDMRRFRRGGRWWGGWGRGGCCGRWGFCEDGGGVRMHRESFAVKSYHI